MTESYLTYRPDGQASGFVGPDAVELYRAATLASSLRLYAKCGMLPTRGVTITKMLALASQYTGKKYRRGQAQNAAEDVTIFVQELKAALPIVEQ